MYSKVYYIVYGFFFSLIVAAVLCLCLTIMQGVAHIDPIFFLMSFAVAFVTSFLVTSIIPLARIAAACAVYFDAKPGTVAFRLLQNVFFSTLIMFFLGLAMTAFMTGVGSAEAMNSMTGQMVETNLFDRFVSLCLQFWPTIVIVAMLSDPAAGGLAKLCVKPEKRYAKMPEGRRARRAGGGGAEVAAEPEAAAEAKAAAQPEAAAEAEATAETMPRAPRCARPAWRLLRSPNPPRTALFVQNSQHRCEKVGE